MKSEGGEKTSPNAELLTRRSAPAWFCVRTQLKREHIAAAHLQQVRGIEVFNPRVRLLRRTRRGPQWSTESLFPNYIFARFVLETLIEKVSYTPAVKFLLRFGDRVPEVPDPVIESLRRELSDLDSQVLTDAPMIGQEVEISAEGFAGTKGVVAQILPGKQRARILIEVMGRCVPAELSLDMVLFNRRNAAEIALKQAAALALKQAEIACLGTVDPAIAMATATSGLADAAENAPLPA